MTVSSDGWLRRRAADGRAVAFVEGATGRRLTWAEVAAAGDAWRTQGALRDRRVGVAISDPLAMAAAFLGALAAGVTIAPLSPGATGPEVAAQARILGLSALVTDTAGAAGDTGGDWAASGLEIWDPGLRPAGATLPAGAPGYPAGAPGYPAGAPGYPAGAGAAVIMTSSGTTGAPKVIPLTQAQLLHTAGAVVSHLGLGPGQRGYSPLPLWHINGLVVGVLAAAVAGSSLVVDRRFSRRSFWHVVADQGVTWLNLVPAIIAVLAAAEPAPDAGPAAPVPPPGVRLARSASAPLADATRRRFEERFGITVVETYGMTEAASQITANPVDGRRRPGSVGRPAGAEVRVVDRLSRPVAAGDAGRVQIRGPSVMPAYWDASGAGRPALTAGGWLPTGDVGWMDGDGYLYLVGREDDVINRGGEKVQPREVEEVLLADPRVLAAAVVGRAHPTVGQEPVAYVIAAPGAGDRGQLVADLGARAVAVLSRFKRPAAITVVDALPAGPTGKVRRADVQRLAAAPPTPSGAR